jgi:hypothetical protein
MPESKLPENIADPDAPTNVVLGEGLISVAIAAPFLFALAWQVERNS